MFGSASCQTNSFYFCLIRTSKLELPKIHRSGSGYQPNFPKSQGQNHPSTITCSSFSDWETSVFFFHRELKNKGILCPNGQNQTAMWQILPWNEVTFQHNALHIWNWLKTTHWYKAILIFQTEVIQVFKDYLTILTELLYWWLSKWSEELQVCDASTQLCFHRNLRTSY